MGLFSSKNNTISDKKMADLRRRAVKKECQDGGMFSKKAVARGKATSANRRKSIWS